MSRLRAWLRVIIISSAALAVSLVPVARAFSDIAEAPATTAALAAPRHASGSSAHRAHRMPRLRKPKQSIAAAPPDSRPALFPNSSARRRVPGRERPALAASFASRLEHPPA